MTGTLYGVGVGPGNPELMTVKAWRLVSTARVIAYLSANGGDSMARAIAAPFFPDDATEIAIDMPMRTDLAPAQKAYDEGAARIEVHLAAGQDVVMLCEGDPFFYGSFINIHERLAARYAVQVIPGVTSMTAAAAEIGSPLARRNGVVKVLPATLDADQLRAELRSTHTAVIIKTGRHFGKVKAILMELGLVGRATAIQNATLDTQSVSAVTSIDEDTVPYFTTILVSSSGETP